MTTPPPARPRPVTGVVLAGGKSARMGAFKPLMPLLGKPLVAYAIEALRPLCAEVLVMGGPRAADLSRVAQARVFADPGLGPHVALRIAAALARHDVLLVVPADMPFLAPSDLEPLLAAPPALYETAGVPNPLLAAYPREALRSALASPARSLQEVARALGAQRLEGHARLADDLDDPADFARARSGRPKHP